MLSWTSCVMLKLSAHLAIWILLLLFSDADVTKNKNHSTKNTLAHNSQDFWETELLGKNDSDRLASSTEISQLESSWIEYKRAVKSKNKKTLMDYNGPAIKEDFDIRSDQVFMSHVRVKRSESTNDSFPYFWFTNNTIYAFGELLPTNHKLESDVVDTTTRTYSWHKRRILSKNEQPREQMRENTRHSKYHIKTQIRGKKRDALKSPRKFSTKKSNSGQRSKNTAINVHTRKIDESQKRESGNSCSNSDVGNGSIDEGIQADKSETLIKQNDPISLTNYNMSKEQREENSVVLPFVHTGKAELRVRIEKIPADESSFINTDNWIDYPTTIGVSSTMSVQSKYETIDEITNSHVTSSKFAPNFDYAGRKRKDVNNTIDSTSSGIKADQNPEDGKYQRINNKVAEFVDEDMKYRAKRNQQITSKRYLQSDMRRLKRFKNSERNIGDVKHEMYRRVRGNRAVRSIEEIKDLVEKLVVKVNELQMYVSNYSGIPHTRDPCVSENANCTPKLSEKSNYKSKFVRDTDNLERLANNQQTMPVEGKAFQLPSSAPRVTRAKSRGRKKSLRKWNRWTDWSSCSVTCGKGRQIRWRHCLRDCEDAEIEMEEKTCQLPACPPGKFLGIF